MASSIVTTVLIPARRDAAWRRGGRTRAGLPRARASGNALRHDLRHRHGRDAVVCRRIGTRRAAEPGAAISSPLRHGAGVGACEPAAHRHLHTHYLRRDACVQRGRRSAGRRVRHRRAGADFFGRRRSGDHEMAPAPPRAALRRNRSNLSVHDFSEHGRAA